MKRSRDDAAPPLPPRARSDAIDTSPEAAALLRRLAREMPPARKLAAAMGMSRAVRRLAEAGVRARHPDADEDELRFRLAAVLLPRDCVVALFGRDPRREG